MHDACECEANVLATSSCCCMHQASALRRRAQLRRAGAACPWPADAGKNRGARLTCLVAKSLVDVDNVSLFVARLCVKAQHQHAGFLVALVDGISIVIDFCFLFPAAGARFLIRNDVLRRTWIQVRRPAYWRYRRVNVVRDLKAHTPQLAGIPGPACSKTAERAAILAWANCAALHGYHARTGVRGCMPCVAPDGAACRRSATGWRPWQPRQVLVPGML